MEIIFFIQTKLSVWLQVCFAEFITHDVGLVRLTDRTRSLYHHFTAQRYP